MADYVLMDSWFTNEPMIFGILEKVSKELSQAILCQVMY